MKSITPASIIALCLLSIATLTNAQTPGSYTAGRYDFIMEDRLTRSVEFEAMTDDRGTTSGMMTYTDNGKLIFKDVDGTGERPPEGTYPFYIKVEFNALTVEKNRALVDGAIVDSSHPFFIGHWVQLVVEDNEGNKEVPDQMVWRICQPEPGGWVPADSELKYDDGAYMSWWATDAERKDDVGIPSPNLIPGTLKSCRVFPLAAYAYANLLEWNGDIVVRQR